MARIDVSQRSQRVFFEAMMSDSLPDDYALEAQEMTIGAIQEGKSDDEIVAWLCEYFRRPHKELNPDLARVLLHKTKSRWQRYLNRYAEATGKAGRPKVMGMKAVLALVSLMKASPRECGYAADSWTVAYLLDALRRWDGVFVSDHTLRRVLHDIGFKWNGKAYSRDMDNITTGDLVSIMRLPYRLNLTDCFDEATIRNVVGRVNEMPPGPIPPEPPDTSESILD
jgi:transposase